MHAAAGFPVKYTWLRAIKKGNLATWPRLTYSNAAKYFPHAVETIKGHMVQYSQGVRSTKKKTHPSRGIKKEPAKATQEKEDEREDIPPPPSKHNNSILGINQSVNSTLMIVGDSLLDPEVVMST